MPGDTSELTFARDGVVVSRAAWAKVTDEAAHWTPGASTLLRLLAGEAVPARRVDDRGAQVSITFGAAGARFSGYVPLRCGAVDVLAAPLTEHEVKGLDAAGHPVHERLARTVEDFFEGADEALVVRLRNVVVRAIVPG